MLIASKVNHNEILQQIIRTYEWRKYSSVDKLNLKNFW